MRQRLASSVRVMPSLSRMRRSSVGDIAGIADGACSKSLHKWRVTNCYNLDALRSSAAALAHNVTLSSDKIWTAFDFQMRAARPWHSGYSRPGPPPTARLARRPPTREYFLSTQKLPGTQKPHGILLLRPMIGLRRLVWLSSPDLLACWPIGFCVVSSCIGAPRT
jgi:hypothetical protein